MAVKIRVDPINLNLSLNLDQMLSPQMQSQILADAAQEAIDDAKAQNASVLGRVPPYTVAVDGRIGAPLNSVRPNGVIFAEFELVFEALQWISDMLEKYSPVKSGAYRASHVLLADGNAVDPGVTPPVASEYVYVSVVPYARKIEMGQSSQAPDGVYQVVAQMAKSSSKFGNVAKIAFGYRTPLFGAIDKWASSPAGLKWAARKRKGAKGSHAEWLRRQPAIIVTL